MLVSREAGVVTPSKVYFHKRNSVVIAVVFLKLIFCQVLADSPPDDHRSPRVL